MGPKVLLVGGPDVDARIDIMKSLSKDFHIAAFGTSYRLKDKFNTENFTFYYYPMSRSFNPVSDIVGFLSLYFLFLHMQPSIVHTFDTKPSIWARLAARGSGVPVVIGTLPGLGSLYSNNSIRAKIIRYFYQHLQKFVCRISDATIFQNRMDKEQFLRIKVVDEDKARVILGSGILTDYFSRHKICGNTTVRLRENLDLKEQNIVVTLIARIIVSKGVIEFGEAAKLIQATYPNVRFLLIGDTDENSLDRLNEMQLENLQNYVQWVGPRNDIREMLALTDIFVLPSFIREGIPRVLLEAASMGLPLITTDSPGCNEVVQHELNGLLIPPRDAVALASAIVKLADNPELRRHFGLASRARAIKEFDIAHVSRQTKELYLEFIERKVKT